MLSSTLRGDRWIVYKARGSTLSEMLRGERRGEGDVTEVCDGMESDKNFLCVLVSSTGLVSSGYPSSSNPETLRLNQDGDGGSTDIRSEARKSSEQQLEGGDAVRVVGSTNSKPGPFALEIRKSQWGSKKGLCPCSQSIKQERDSWCSFCNG